MSYTAVQINETIAYIIKDIFAAQPVKKKQAIENILRTRIKALIKANPRESKIAIDVQDQVLFAEFFEYLKNNDLIFPKNVRYTLKIHGESIAARNGDETTLIIKPKKDSSKKQSHNANDIIDALQCLHVNEEDEFSEEYELSEDDKLSEDESEDENNSWNYYKFFKMLRKAEAEAEYEAAGKPSGSDAELEEETPDVKAQRKAKFEKSNQSKSKRGLYYQAKALVAKEKEQRTFYAKVVLPADTESDPEPEPEKAEAVRFKNEKPKTYFHHTAALKQSSPVKGAKHLEVKAHSPKPAAHQPSPAEKHRDRMSKFK
jgi:hypothetical protein